MRQITESDLLVIKGGSAGGAVGYIAENTLVGLGVGIVFPGIAHALELTAVVTNPILATGALFGTYAIAEIIASAITGAVLR